MKKNNYKWVIIIITLLIGCSFIKNNENITKSFDLGLILKNNICITFDSLSKQVNKTYKVFAVYIHDFDKKKEQFSFSMSYIIPLKPCYYLAINPTHKIQYSNEIILVRYNSRIDSSIINLNFEKINKKDYYTLKQKIYSGMVEYESISVICKYRKGKLSTKWIYNPNDLKNNEYDIIDYNYWKLNNDSLSKIEFEN